MLLLSTVLLLTSALATGEECPQQCNCSIVRTKYQKLKCGGGVSRITSLESLNLESSLIVQLDLSSNELTILQTSFLHVPNLEKLDISSNNISIIEPGAFYNLTTTRRLDLSHNKLQSLKKYIFDGLVNLERLKLTHNAIITVHEQTFDYLPALKLLDISENQLHCDCRMLWFAEWTRNTSAKLNPAPKCETPISIRGQPIKKFKIECDDKTDFDSWVTLDLKPVNNQIVFEGDSLVLKCSSFNIESGDENADARIIWLWEDKNPASQFDAIKIENRFHGRSGFVESSLNIDHIIKDHSGNWNCCLLTNHGNHSRTISVIVISQDTLYCQQTITSNNKGLYFWPKTISGFIVELPCEEQVSNSTQRSLYKSYHTCSEAGEWVNLDTSLCPYISEATKVLEQFSKVNLSISKKSVLESAIRLKNYTGNGRELTDSMDIEFIAKTIENYLPYIPTEKELGPVLVDILAYVLQQPSQLLKVAQREYSACSRMIASVDVVAKYTPTLQSHKPNLAVENFKIKREIFSGITCTWYTAYKNPTRLFQCTTSNKTVAFLGDKVIEASIQIPASLFHQLELQKQHVEPDNQLLVSMYENNHFFPRLDGNDKKDVTSCVVGSKLVNTEVVNLTDPVYVILKVTFTKHSSPPKPVWYDSNLNNGTGGWREDGCIISHFQHDLVVFSCDRMGYFGILQDSHFLHQHSGRYIGAKFRLCHPAIYIGSFILISCLIVAIVTYATSSEHIQMSRRARHSLVNIWISISLLCFIFTFGVFQTEAMRTCQGIGLVLHYFSLSTLLWMSVAANNMYKKWSKTDLLDHGADDDLPADIPIQKPILGLYLVGWGIGLIICGISGAVNLKEYAGHAFCFFSSGPALSAVFVPAILFLVFLLISYLLTLCAIRNHDMNGQLSEGTQGTENVDLELLEVPLNNCPERHSVRSIMTPTDSDDIEDPEHSPLVQLKAQIIVLIFYLIAWMSAAISISQAFTPHVAHEEDIFSTLYCCISIFMGTFILYFYCVARSDVRHQWFLLKKMFQGNQHCCRTRNISDTLSPLPVSTNPPVPVRNGTHHAVPTLSSSSVNSSGFTTKSNGHQSIRVKAVQKLNKSDNLGEPVVMHSKTTNSVNLVVMHRQMYRSNTSMPTYHEISGPEVAQAFYNPHQSIVAKKFFKKQKRNKRSDLGLRRRGDGGGTSDGGMSQNPRPWRPSAESAVFLSSDMENVSDKLGPTLFNHGSKVNNTNLHVKANKQKRGRTSKDPNILTNSEGEDEIKTNHLPFDRLVIGAEETTEKQVKPDSPVSRIDEDGNSTAVNMSEVSECLQRKENDTTDDEVFEETTLCPDYRNVELQCSLGEHSCSDLNSEINYCDSTNNDEYACCLEPDACPSDCCSKNQRPTLSHSSSCSYEESKLPVTLEESEHSEDEETLQVIDEDSFCRKIDDLHFTEDPKSPPKYVTVIDPLYGIVKVTVGEYQQSAHKFSLAAEKNEDAENKTETSV